MHKEELRHRRKLVTAKSERCWCLQESLENDSDERVWNETNGRETQRKENRASRLRATAVYVALPQLLRQNRGGWSRWGRRNRRGEERRQERETCLQLRIRWWGRASPTATSRVTSRRWSHWRRHSRPEEGLERLEARRCWSLLRDTLLAEPSREWNREVVQEQCVDLRLQRLGFVLLRKFHQYIQVKNVIQISIGSTATIYREACWVLRE